MKSFVVWCFLLGIANYQYAAGLISLRRDVLRSIGEGASSLLIAGSDNGLLPLNDDDDPSQLFLSKQRCNNIRIPRIGYSLYKTPADQVVDGVTLALDAGVRHFDVATQYGTTDLVGQALRTSSSAGVSIAHKVSNMEQSTHHRAVQQSVQKQLRLLPKDRVKERIVLVHSPIGSDATTRINTYAALAELKAKGEIDAIGTAHFGVGALNQLVNECDLPPPDVIQLELSPFHAHRDIAAWGRQHDAVLSCAAWSKLSSVDGPQTGWETLGKLATAHACTKQQILIRWAVQNNYTCVPRSNSQFKVEKQTIRENSWMETQQIVLTDAELKLLDSLDEQLPAGRLRVLDGWSEADIVDAAWDPTNIV